MYSLNPVFLHDSGNPVFAAGFANFVQIAMNPPITVYSSAQRIGVADKFSRRWLSFSPAETGLCSQT
jgi:hypothetical protein